MVFDLLKLEQYLKSYELFQFKSFSVFTVRAGPQVGPGRVQAGMEAKEAGLIAGPYRGQAGVAPEAAGLVAGPGRALGRASIGTSRPAGRLRPMPRPGCAGTCGDGDGRRRRRATARARGGAEGDAVPRELEWRGGRVAGRQST